MADVSSEDLMDELKLKNNYYEDNDSILSLLKVSFGMLKDIKKSKFIMDEVKKRKALAVNKYAKDEKRSEKSRKNAKLHFKNGDIRFSIEYFNEAITYSPKCIYEDFFNRSVVFQKMKLWKACIMDLNIVIDSKSYPKKKVFELYLRKLKCLKNIGDDDNFHSLYNIIKKEMTNSNADYIEKRLNKINDGSRYIYSSSEYHELKKKIIEPVGGFHENILNTTKNASIRHKDNVGRYIVSTTNIEPNSLITIEEPIQGLMKPEHLKSHCSYCLLKFFSFKSCRGCTLLRFCSEICEEKSWTEYHNVECTRFHDLSVNANAQIMFRCLIKCGKEKLLGFKNKILSGELDTDEYKASLKYGTDYESLLSLCHEYQYLSNNDILISLINSIYLGSEFPDDYIESLGIEYLEAILFVHQIQGLVNNFNINDQSEVESIGTAIYCNLSLFNNCCLYNCKRTFDGNKMVLKTLRFIRAGEELAITYGDHKRMHISTHTYEQRALYFQTNFGFMCKCRACDIPKYEENKMFLISLLKNLNNENITVEDCEAILVQLKVIMPEGHIDIMICTNILYKMYVHKGNITQAMVHLDLSRDILIVLFGKKSPEYIDLLHQYHYIYRLTVKEDELQEVIRELKMLRRTYPLCDIFDKYNVI